MRKNSAAAHIRAVAVTGLMAATIEVGKLCLASIPNVEVVTLLCAVYGYVFGPFGMVAAGLFVCMEVAVWGFNTWVISYFLYWPLVAFVFWMLCRLHLRNRFLMTGVAVLLTAYFSFLTSVVDIGLFSGKFDRFWARFAIYYGRGITFYVVQIVCNAVLFPLLFPVFANLLLRLKNKMFPAHKPKLKTEPK